ncbi:MAG TPA: hypothetical protein VGW78_06585 [Candidatus Babeliales bacterium]|nr:hypothetical protein [Candidatus Babeliales bacterium]
MSYTASQKAHITVDFKEFKTELINLYQHRHYTVLQSPEQEKAALIDMVCQNTEQYKNALDTMHGHKLCAVVSAYSSFIFLITMGYNYLFSCVEELLDKQEQHASHND